MDKCSLCLTRDANQTGSHIFTYALIKTAINQAGHLKRDKEVTFKIGSYDLGETFFGRGIQPEKIVEVLGRDLTEEEIEQNKNFFTVDNLVCDRCERRFTIAENYFLDKIYKNLCESKLDSSLDSKNNRKISISEEINIIRLFIYIQIWRASAARFNEFKLKPKIEEKLRRIIDNCLVNEDLNETIKKSHIISGEIRSFPLIITFVETEVLDENKKELTGNLVSVTPSKIPNFFILNNIYIQFYANESHIKSSIDNLFGLSRMLPKKEHSNFQEKEFIIGILPDENRNEIINTLYRCINQNLFDRLRRTYNQTHLYLTRLKPSTDEVNNVIYEVAQTPRLTAIKAVEIMTNKLTHKLRSLGIKIEDS